MKKNIGGYIISIVILIRAILILFFYLKKMFNIIKYKIRDITFAFTKLKLISKYKKEQKIKNTEKIDDNNNIENIDKNLENISQDNNNNNLNINIAQQIFGKKKKKKKRNKYRHKLFTNSKKKSLSSINIINVEPTERNSNDLNRNNNNNRGILNNNIENININKELKLNIKEIITKTENIMKYNDEELNGASYEFAIKNDKRNFIQYYFSLLLTKHIIISTFFNENDYNITLIKIDLFIFNFVLYFSINALFFSDNTMHKIYEDKGSYNFIYQLPQILYSSIISGLINFAVKKLALSQDAVLDYKSIEKQKNLKNIKNEELIRKEQNLNKKLKIKFGFYFIISTIIICFFWYYLGMFCAIYQNTQIHLIKDTLISYGLGFIYPFGIYLLPGMFRIPSLSNNNNKRKCCYDISKLLQMI